MAERQQDSSTGSDGYRRLIELGIALSAEHDHDRLMEMILVAAKDLTNADGGTLYLKTEANTLTFQIVRTESLNIALGGTTGAEITFPDLRLYDEQTGEANHNNVATHAALTGESVNIKDAYESTRFDFSGTKKFDEGTGYRSKSFLTVPLKNHDGDVTGVLQLLNAQSADGEVIPFSSEVQPLVEALASQAAVTLNNQFLLQAQRDLMNAFIELLAGAIDAKSAYTGGHCQRVPELTKMLTKAACESDDPRFKDFDLTDEEWYELHIAAWLHDCGKVTTPEYVVDKATKLETIYNRIHEIRTRFEVLKRDAEIKYLRAVIDGGDAPALKADYEAEISQLDDDYAFIAESNIGGEFMSDDKVERVKQIAARSWWRTLDDRLGLSADELRRVERTAPPILPVEEPVLGDREDHIVTREAHDIMPSNNRWGFKIEVPEHKYNLGEVYNLCIGRGTLTEEERYTINGHMVQTIIMLDALPFPKHLRRVPEIAGGHHEKMDGTGYPKRLTREDMSIPARIMAIADIFEALTAADRPYKAPKTLSESVRIMSFMRNDQHIDPDLFDLFLDSGIYKLYAEEFLDPSQIDEINIDDYKSNGAG